MRRRVEKDGTDDEEPPSSNTEEAQTINDTDNDWRDDDEVPDIKDTFILQRVSDEFDMNDPVWRYPFIIIALKNTIRRI
jgi:hypothetical protein